MALTAIGEDLTKGEALIREIFDVVPTLAFHVVWESLEHHEWHPMHDAFL